MPQETPSAPVPSGGAERLTLSLEPVRWLSSAAFSKHLPWAATFADTEAPGPSKAIVVDLRVPSCFAD